MATWSFDNSHSSIGFSVRHLMISKVRGHFNQWGGTFDYDEKDPTRSKLSVRIDAASIDTRDEKRDAHLRSPDFFDVERYPTMTYRSTAVTAAGNGKWAVDGDLTAHGVTQPVQLLVDFEGGVTDPWGNARAGFSATAEIDREAFGITFNQVLEGGGVLVGKSVKIEIEAEAVRQV
jgi:polyisoprenoid-binding protein YceI